MEDGVTNMDITTTQMDNLIFSHKMQSSHLLRVAYVQMMPQMTMKNLNQIMMKLMVNNKNNIHLGN
jgi:hypothetical protein